MEKIEIRTASLDDCREILEIYAYYVTNTAITFEYDVPTETEFRARMEKTLQKYPYLVAVRDGEIMGYAYAGAFVGRAAYDWSAEMTIYLKHTARKCGIGRKLYEALEEYLKEMGVLNLYACIGDPEVEDEYLTKNSAKFHAHLGFQKVGDFYKCGYKFNRWYNMIWMEKIIGEHKTEQKVPDVKTYSKLKQSVKHRKATPQDLEYIWNRNIADHPEDRRWVDWKKEFISYNERGEAVTFVVVCDEQPVGEGTLLFSEDCKAISGRNKLADNVHTTNINALRIRKEYEGKGYIAALVRKMEQYAAEHGYDRVTIGVDAKETRNLAIYLHLGYDKFVMSEIEGGELVLYYAKELKRRNP